MLVSVEDMRLLHGASISDDQKARWEMLLSVAEEEVLSYASLESGAVEEHFPGGADSYVLTHCPVLEVVKASCDGQDVAIGRIDARSDTVHLAAVTPEGSDVCIFYTCGWAEGRTPAIILKAIAFTASHLNRLEAGRLLGTTQRTTDGGSEQIEQSTPPLAVQKMLERFRRNRAL